MNHFLMMVLFAAFVAIVFGIVGREKTLERFTYGTKIFLEFVCIGLLLAWVLYWFPL